MRGRIRGKHLLWVGLILAAALVQGGWARAAEAAVRLVVDGREVQASPAPAIRDGRTLVPVRVVAENLGAVVQWEAQDRSVTVVRGSRRVKMRLDNRLVDLGGANGYLLTDVPPSLIKDRTFIPLRLVAETLGVWIGWDAARGTVRVDSGREAAVAPPVLAFSSPQPGQVLTGATDLKVTVTGPLPGEPAEVRYFLLDPATGRGPIVARGQDLNAAYRLVPDPGWKGTRLVAAAAYDRTGKFVGGAVVPVELAVSPQVGLAGVAAGQRITGTIALSAEVNFLAAYVSYRLGDPATGQVTELAQADPYGPFNWTPVWADNGPRTLQAVAYDRLGQAYAGPVVPVEVAVERKFDLRGVKEGAVVDGPVNLGVSLNFSARQVQYLLRYPDSGCETVLATVGGASGYRWFPGPDQAGRAEVLAVIADDQGNTFSTPAVAVEVKGTPRLVLATVGPRQVLAGEVTLRSEANVPLQGIEYHLVDPRTGAARAIVRGTDARASYTWRPAGEDAGYWNLRAVGTTSSGEKLSTSEIPVRVYAGKIYGPQPIVAKDQFIDLVSPLARQVLAETGMSAALQVAQAILETGWGQSVPVDKYTGQPSYNLFGIKGEGPAGSIVSNTWEEYNGVVYRVDAAFRAYHNLEEGWRDHQQFLLTGSRYAPFRAVTHSAEQGAWALKRCGYATDSKYAVKLIDLIRRYQLDRLDEVGV
ncbi:MAG: glucosaminidase domain-containing protein [Moorellales bacterium]